MRFNLRNTIGVVPRKSDSELYIELSTGSTIWYKSGEVLDNLRSETLNGVIVDEMRQQHPNLFKLVIRPMLTTTRGWGSFISTPNGFDHFYDLWNSADSLGWWKLQAPSTCNPLITQEEIDEAKATMSEPEFAQEYLAEFRDLTSGKAYINHGEWNHRTDNPFWSDGPLHPQLPICVAMDFNLSPMAWTLGQRKIDEFYAFDEIWLKNSHTPQAAEVLAQKILALGHEKTGVVLVGDSTANAGQRAAAGQSDYDIVCQTLDRHKIKWQNYTPESNPQVKDRVNNVNAKLKDAAGITRFWYNPKTCPNLKKDFDRVVWKQTAQGALLDQTTNKDLTHASDGVGYWMWAMSPLQYKNRPTTMKVIMR